jgi:aspartyl-tRNA(Asn)/glutamyl-tRNA(Gln) amidotransferase subunit C
MKLEDVKKLAELARIDIEEGEMIEIAKDFDAILAYVGQVQEVSKLYNVETLHENSDNYFLQNVMREDIVINKEGEYTEKVLANAPDTQDGYLKVKQIM